MSFANRIFYSIAYTSLPVGKKKCVLMSIILTLEFVQIPLGEEVVGHGFKLFEGHSLDGMLDNADEVRFAILVGVGQSLLFFVWLIFHFLY